MPGMEHLEEAIVAISQHDFSRRYPYFDYLGTEDLVGQ
jgi:hypothetical protein